MSWTLNKYITPDIAQYEIQVFKKLGYNFKTFYDEWLEYEKLDNGPFGKKIDMLQSHKTRFLNQFKQNYDEGKSFFHNCNNLNVYMREVRSIIEQCDKKSYWTYVGSNLRDLINDFKEKQAARIIETTAQQKQVAKEKASEIITCECGEKTSRHNLSRHRRTEKHIFNLLNNSENFET